MFSSDGERAIVVRSDGHVLLLKTRGGQVLGVVQPFQRDTMDRHGVASVYAIGDEAVILVGGHGSAAHWDFITGALTAVEFPRPLASAYHLRHFWRSAAQLVTVDVRQRQLEGVAWAAPGVARGRWRLQVQPRVDDIESIAVHVTHDGRHVLLRSDDHGAWQLRRVDTNADIFLGDQAHPFSAPNFDLAGRYIAALAGEREIKFWSVADGRLVRTVEPGWALTGIRWARSGDSVYAFARDGSASPIVRVSVTTGVIQQIDPTSIFIDSTGYVVARPPSLETATEEIIAISPDGTHVLLESDTALRFVRTSDGVTVGVVPVLAPPDVASGATWLPNAELLLSSRTGSWRASGAGVAPVPCLVDPAVDWETAFVAPHVAHTRPDATVSSDARFSIREGTLCPLNEAASAFPGPLDLYRSAVDIYFTLAEAGVAAGGDVTTLRLYPLPRLDTSNPLELPPARRCEGCDLRVLGVSRENLVLTDGVQLQVNDPGTGLRRFLETREGYTPESAELPATGGGAAVLWRSDSELADGSGAGTWRVHGPEGELLQELPATDGVAFYLGSTTFVVPDALQATLVDLVRRTRAVLDVGGSTRLCNEWEERDDDGAPTSCLEPHELPSFEAKGVTLLVRHPESVGAPARIDAYLPPYVRPRLTMSERAAVSGDGTRVYDCAAGRLRATTLASLEERDLGPCLHGEIVAGEDPRFVVILAGSTVHVVRPDGVRIELMSFEQEARHLTVVRDAASGQFELVGDPLLVTRIGHRTDGPLYGARVEDARSSRRNTPGLLQRFFSGAPLGSATER